MDPAASLSSDDPNAAACEYEEQPGSPGTRRGIRGGRPAKRKRDVYI